MQKDGQKWIGSQDEEKRRQKEREMKNWQKQEFVSRAAVLPREDLIPAA